MKSLNQFITEAKRTPVFEYDDIVRYKGKLGKITGTDVEGDPQLYMVKYETTGTDYKEDIIHASELTPVKKSDYSKYLDKTKNFD